MFPQYRHPKTILTQLLESQMSEIPSSRSLPMARDVEHYNLVRHQQEQQRIEKQREAKRLEEFNNKKIVLSELMLQKYYERLDALALYNKQKTLERAQAEQGRFVDIEIR